MSSYQCTRVKWKSYVDLFCSFADLQKPQAELDGKECAAVGQSGLMSLYDALFTQVLCCLGNAEMRHILFTTIFCLHA